MDRQLLEKLTPIEKVQLERIREAVARLDEIASGRVAFSPKRLWAVSDTIHAAYLILSRKV